MIPPEAYYKQKLHLRKTALYHLQVELDRTSNGDALRSVLLRRSYAQIQIEGRIIRLFRFGGPYGVGDVITFKIHVNGPPAWFRSAPPCIEELELLYATHIEVYLNEESGERIAYEFKLLPKGGTIEPAMNAEELEQRPTWSL